MTSRAQQRHPELEQRCDWEPCHAQPGSPCTNRHNEPRETPHPGRKDAWIRAHVTCPDCGAPDGGGLCLDAAGAPLKTSVHRGRLHAAQTAYEQALEEASRDVKGRPR